MPMFTFLFRALVAFPLFAGLLDAQQTPPANDWAVTSAPARFTVETDAGDRPAPLTYAEITVPLARWLGEPVRVFDEKGQAEGCEIVSTAPGEPTVLLFDSSSGTKHYTIYLGIRELPALPLKDDRAGVWLEAREGDAREIDTLPAMIDAWKQAAARPVGRAIVEGIFEGGNRFGPQRPLLLHFTGYFSCAAPEHLNLAVMSTDSAFVLVDGKEVVEWPGAHDVWGGMHGEHQGGVDLAAGRHVLEYYNDYFRAPGPPLLACLASQGGPVDSWQMLRPGNFLFSPVARAHVVDYEAQGPAAPPLVVDWTTKAQSVAEHDNADVGFVTLSLSCRPPPTGTVTWSFDDGTTATGATVDHLFPRPGLRSVAVEVSNGTPTPPVRQLIHVHPDWHLLTTASPDLRPEDQADLLGRDPNTFTPSDLASCLAVFGTYKSLDALTKLQPAACAQMKNIPDADLPYIKTAAAVVAADLSSAKASDPLLRALVDRCGTTPALTAIASWARLNLAQVLLLTSDRTDEVKALLAGIALPSLTGEDRRRCAILQADWALATGDIATARKSYTQITGNPTGPDARSGVRQTGRIGAARAFLDRGDTEAADAALQQVAWEAPIEKMSSEWALTQLKLYEAEKLPDVAYLDAKRLLPVIDDGARSELLFQMTELAAERGDRELAGKTLTELLQQHAYSEEAAQAKAKWPGGV